LAQPTDRLSSNHLFVIRFATEEIRQKVIEALTLAEIQYGHHYMNNANYPMYTHLPKEPLLNMTTWNKTALTLPLHLYLTLEDVDRISDCIIKAVQE
jgi:dTDP-4-amino-4,6-dideoxygalactose transaminase